MVFVLNEFSEFFRLNVIVYCKIKIFIFSLFWIYETRIDPHKKGISLLKAACECSICIDLNAEMPHANRHFDFIRIVKFIVTFLQTSCSPACLLKLPFFSFSSEMNTILLHRRFSSPTIRSPAVYLFCSSPNILVDELQLLYTFSACMLALSLSLFPQNGQWFVIDFSFHWCCLVQSWL